MYLEKFKLDGKIAVVTGAGQGIGLACAEALAEAGASLADVVRANYYVPNVSDWPTIAPVLGEFFGDIRPAATAVVCDLVDPRMKIEIEVTARRKV